MRRLLGGGLLLTVLGCAQDGPVEPFDLLVPITGHVASLDILAPDSVTEGDEVDFAYALGQSGRQGDETLTEGTQQLHFVVRWGGGDSWDSVAVPGVFSERSDSGIPLPVAPDAGDTVRIVGSGTAALTASDGTHSELEVSAEARLTIVVPRGSVQVSVTVAGNGVDADGFRVRLADRTVTVLAGASASFADMPAGDRQLTLDGVASHCHARSAELGVTVERDTTVEAAFEVECYADLLYTQWVGPLQDQLWYLDAEGKTRKLTPWMEGGQWSAAWAPDGASVAFEQVLEAEHDIFVADLSGGVTAVAARPGRAEMFPAWSPDGEWIVYQLLDTGGGFFTTAELRVVRPDGTDDHVLHGGGGIDLSPVWSPDGSWVAFACWKPRHAICFVRPDGRGLFRAPIEVWSPQHLSWSPDGSRLAFEDFSDRQQIRILDLDSWTLVNAAPGVVSFDVGKWSPDGTQVAVQTHEDGVYRVRVVDADGTTSRVLLAARRWADGWSPDGRKIPYSDQDSREIRLVDVSTLEDYVLYVGSPDVVHTYWRPAHGDSPASARALLRLAPPPAEPVPSMSGRHVPVRPCRPFIVRQRGSVRLTCVP